MRKILQSSLTLSIVLNASCASPEKTNYLFCVYDKNGTSRCKDAGPEYILENSKMDGFVCSPAADHWAYVLGCEEARRKW